LLVTEKRDFNDHSSNREIEEDSLPWLDKNQKSPVPVNPGEMPLRELLGLVLNVVSLKEQLPTLEQTKIKKEALERHLKLETLGMTVRQSNTEIKLEPSSEPINESENGE
ncbi:hypothetical protein X801_07088, partial [Opisthorchis viverrini]